MDILYAKNMIQALAEGINPITGEILPQSDVCNQVEVVRAFYTILQHLNTENQKEETKTESTRPANSGKPWTTEEDELLIQEFYSKKSFSEMAKKHQRTSNAIKARLERLDLIKL